MRELTVYACVVYVLGYIQVELSVDCVQIGHALQTVARRCTLLKVDDSHNKQPPLIIRGTNLLVVTENDPGYTCRDYP